MATPPTAPSSGTWTVCDNATSTPRQSLAKQKWNWAERAVIGSQHQRSGRPHATADDLHSLSTTTPLCDTIRYVLRGLTPLFASRITLRSAVIGARGAQFWVRLADRGRGRGQLHRLVSIDLLLPLHACHILGTNEPHTPQVGCRRCAGCLGGL